MRFKTRSRLQASAAAASCVCGGLQVTVLLRLLRIQVGSRSSTMANRFQKEVQIPLYLPLGGWGHSFRFYIVDGRQIKVWGMGMD